jgi:hypothetical protein
LEGQQASEVVAEPVVVGPAVEYKISIGTVVVPAGGVSTARRVAVRRRPVV